MRRRSFALAAASLTLHPSLAEVAADSNGLVDSGYFGAHLHRLFPERGAYASTRWPANEIASLRLWDSGTRWADVAPARGRWNFDRLDAYLDAAEVQGASLLCTLGSTPRWASARPDEPGAVRPRLRGGARSDRRLAGICRTCRRALSLAHTSVRSLERAVLLGLCRRPKPAWILQRQRRADDRHDGDPAANHRPGRSGGSPGDPGVRERRAPARPLPGQRRRRPGRRHRLPLLRERLSPIREPSHGGARGDGSTRRCTLAALEHGMRRREERRRGSECRRSAGLAVPDPGGGIRNGTLLLPRVGQRPDRHGRPGRGSQRTEKQRGPQPGTGSRAAALRHPPRSRPACSPSIAIERARDTCWPGRNPLSSSSCPWRKDGMLLRPKACSTPRLPKRREVRRCA